MEEPTSPRHRRAAGRGRLALAAATLLLAAGCGGGFIVGDGFFLSINAFVNGRIVGDPIRSGSTVSLTLQAGQSAQFDANEPADWRFSVNGGPFQPAGASVLTGGLTVTVHPLGRSSISVETTLTGPATLPATVLLVATSTRDAAEVATVQLTVR